MDSLEQRYERVRDAVQQAILRNFPNPERKGCPGDKVVREIAGRRNLIEDDAWRHITHCSPCYATFLQCKDEFRRQRRRRGLLILAGVAALLALIVSVTISGVMNRTTNIVSPSSLTSEAAILDLRGRSAQRGAQETASNAAPLSLPNRPLDLTIYLPLGSEPGKYEIRLSKAGRTLVTIPGNAHVNQGNTVLRIKIDLSKYTAGDYSVGVRQPSWNWVEYPVTLR
ncbi:MAG: hypothetical protein ACR2JB_23070 [Bryobacteraceae bacterium]